MLRVTSLTIAAALAVLLTGAVTGGVASAEESRTDKKPIRTGKYDRHEGYYYPALSGPPEIYKARAVTLPDANRKRRLAFVTALTNQMMKNPYPPPFAIFAKGDDAEKIIIVSLGGQGFETLYQARALLAILTSSARVTPIFRNNRVEDIFTFFDLLKLQGFERLTISDGKTFSHQVRFK